LKDPGHDHESLAKGEFSAGCASGSRRIASTIADQDFGAGAGAGSVPDGGGAVTVPGAGAGTTGAVGLPKSTFGGAVMALSSATVKFGFTFILKIIAVMLVGNWRTVVLNSWTVLM
jgi:hypothetical protein